MLRSTFIARRLLSSTRVVSQPSTAKISEIVENIAQLNLLETSALIAQLKIKLNISEVIVQSAPQSTQQAAAAAPVEAVAEKTHFSIKLESFDAASKAKVIREIKLLIPGSNLVEVLVCMLKSNVQAKKFVESCPKVVRDNVGKEEAEKIKAVLEAIGAKVVLE